MTYIQWDQYFMALANISALRSKDPNTKVGAVLVNENNRVIGLGYNGMPKGNDNFPWIKNGKKMDVKYSYVIHAEMNALLNATTNVANSKLYISLFPCSNCAKLISQADIKEIIYYSNKYKNTEDSIISNKILKDSFVKIRKIGKLKIKISYEN